MQLSQRLRPKRHSPHHHRIQENPQRPDIRREPHIPLPREHLGRDVGGGPALLAHKLVLAHDLGDAEVADLDASVGVKEDVVELHVPVDDRAAVDVGESVEDLTEDAPGVLLLDAAAGLDELEEVSASCVLHDHEEVFVGFEDFEEADDVGVFDFLEDVDFLEDFFAVEVVFHEGFGDGFDGDVFSGELVDAEGDGAEGAFADEFDEFVEFEGC